MSTKRENVNRPDQAEPTVTSLAEDMPIEGDSDPRQQLAKLSLGMMHTQPELSKTQNKDILQAIIFGELTGLTGPKELPKAKSDAEKYTYGLVGMIEGVNAITGEMFKAGIVYLPGGFHDMFLAEMESQLKAAGPGNVTVSFALEFYSTPSGNPRGYSWKARNKMPIERHDPLARLRQRALAGATIKQIEHRAS
jgi:hypothetical protein